MANEEAIQAILHVLIKKNLLNGIVIIDEAFVRLVINAYEDYPHKHPGDSEIKWRSFDDLENERKAYKQGWNDVLEIQNSCHVGASDLSSEGYKVNSENRHNKHLETVRPGEIGKHVDNKSSWPVAVYDESTQHTETDFVCEGVRKYGKVIDTPFPELPKVYSTQNRDEK